MALRERPGSPAPDPGLTLTPQSQLQSQLPTSGMYKRGCVTLCVPACAMACTGTSVGTRVVCYLHSRSYSLSWLAHSRRCQNHHSCDGSDRLEQMHDLQRVDHPFNLDDSSGESTLFLPTVDPSVRLRHEVHGLYVSTLLLFQSQVKSVAPILS
jgi:hypothetical protein